MRANEPAKRWGVTPGIRVWVGGHNTHAKREVAKRLKGTVRPPTGRIDLAFIAPQSVDEAVYFARKLRSRLVSNGVIWVVYPDEASPRRGEFAGGSRDLVGSLARAGYCETGAATLAGNYTSLCFSPARDVKQD